MSNPIVNVLVVVVMIGLMPSCQPAGERRGAVDAERTQPAIRTIDSTLAPDGVEVFYEKAGEGDTAIVFVHGWSCDRSYWRDQFDEFTSRYRVVSVDLGGHGDSGLQRNEWTMQTYGADVRAVVDALGLERIVLVGHSMGGPVIVEAAKLMPERTAGVIAVDFFHDVNNPLSDEEIDAFVAPMLDDFSGYVYELARSFFGPNSDTPLADRVAHDMASAPPEVAIPSVRSTFEYDEAAGLASIEAPIWLINADWLPTDLAALREHNEAIRLAVVPAAGHFVMMDTPQEFNRILERAVRATASTK